MPTAVLQFQSPWSILNHKPPDLSQLKVVGCACYPFLRPYTTHKLDPRTKECVFVIPLLLKGICVLILQPTPSIPLDMFCSMNQNFPFQLLHILLTFHHPFSPIKHGFLIFSIFILQISLLYLVMFLLLLPSGDFRNSSLGVP